MRERFLIIVITLVLCGMGCSPRPSGGLGSSTQLGGPGFSDKEQDKIPEAGAEAERVVEQNIIRKIDFVGNRAYTDKTLRKKLGFKVGDRIDPILAEAYRETISEFYINKGFAFTDVALDGEKLKDGFVVYTIDEGPRVIIARVGFSGNKVIKSSALKKIIKIGEKRWLVLPRYYVEEEVAEDVLRLKNIYYNRGYLDYNIKPMVDYSKGKSRAHIIFEINEGPVYIVRNIIFAGAESFSEQALLEGLKLEQGQAYSKKIVDSHAKRLGKFYRERGYIDAKIEQRPQFIADVNIVNVMFDITEDRQYRIGQIDISGNESTQDKVIRRVLDEREFSPGQLYNADIAPKSGGGKLERELKRMMMAEEVMIGPVAPISGESNQKDVKVDVKEGRTGMIMIGGAVSSDAAIMGQLVYNQRNFDITDWPKSFKEFITGRAFKGGGQSLRIAAEPGTEVSQYSITFTEPYFRDKPESLDVAGSSWGRWRESYDEQRTKGFVGLERRFKSKWRRSIGLRCENVNADDLEIDAPQEIVDIKGDNLLVGVRLGFGRDLRDDVLYPSAGSMFNVHYEQVTGDENFGVAGGTYRWYKKLYEDLAERKTVLTTQLKGGYILGDAQPFEKFYAGGTGTYSIRGFQYRGVSTRGLQRNVPNPQREDPIGSDWIFLANAEVTLPLFSDNFSALFFVDSGVIDTGGYRASAGVGVQIMIPQWFGPVPMRFELAAPFMKDDEDETRAFSFSIGRMF